jgi:hypothetical protein
LDEALGQLDEALGQLDEARKQIADLQAEIHELRSQLNRNSSNSSSPPSVDPPGASNADHGFHRLFKYLMFA